jgi:hypothetical protein
MLLLGCSCNVTAPDKTDGHEVIDTTFEDVNTSVFSRSGGISVTIHRRGIVHKRPHCWMHVSANQTAQQWVWGNEIVVNHGSSEFHFNSPGPNYHNVCYPAFGQRPGDPNYNSPSWVRSTDGGITWSTFDEPATSGEATYPINFAHCWFGLRFGGSGSWITYDKWHSKKGPYPNLIALPPGDYECTTRTDYIVNDSNDIMLFQSARSRGKDLEDFAYMSRTTDGGQSSRLVSYITSPSDSCRGVMPSGVRLDPNTLVTAVRRRRKPTGDWYVDNVLRCWIDVYRTDDNGTSWHHISKVDETGINNGNPPALARLPNGLLVVVYGVRLVPPIHGDNARISAKVSDDNGLTWSDEFRLHENYHYDWAGYESFYPHGDSADLGYARLFVRPDASLIAIYAWSDGPDENHIHYTHFSVDGGDSSGRIEK